MVLVVVVVMSAATFCPSFLGPRQLYNSIPEPGSRTDSFPILVLFLSLLVSGVTHLQSVPHIQKPSIYSSRPINSSNPGQSWALWESTSK